MKVSVIVPNYNHAKFLPRRIESILDQTYADFELLILDDMSLDDSRDVIAHYASDRRIRTEYNTANSGNTFAQWKKGIDLTSAEYIWIAESDDYADPALLGRLVAILDTLPTVGIAVCESAIVDDLDNIIGIAGELDRKNMADTSFAFPAIKADYTQAGREYCRQYMVPWNSIPNASAVLFRRSAINAIGGPVIEMRICGDWFTYCKILMRSDISRIPEPLNFFRTHPNNVRSRTKFATFLREQRKVRAYVNAELGIKESWRRRLVSLMFETQLVIGAERRPPKGKVPLRRLLATLMSAARFGPGLFTSTLGILAKEQAAMIVDSVRLRVRTR